MKIEQELYISGLRFRATIESKTLETHSKMQALTTEDHIKICEILKEAIKSTFFKMKEREPSNGGKSRVY